ncbi:MAG: SusC/RagA family TonB-linked outer membrane protein [Prevotella sp.]|nr:SusC/RagA family TonB-linked outer membrane protein [Prevotella sp.]
MEKKRIFFMALCLFLWLLPTAAQTDSRASSDKKITMTFNNESLPAALSRLEKSSGYKFSFSYGDVSRYQVKGTVKNKTLPEVLDYLLDGKPLSYTISGRLVDIKPKGQTPTTGTKSLVTGNVVDNEGNPVIGATVYVDGNKQYGTVTDIDGNFQLNVDDGVSSLYISSIGFDPYRLDISKKRSGLKASLRISPEAIDEVVVTGIYQRNVESFTGSATTFSSKELKQIGNTNVLQSLKTLDPSFNLMDNNTMGSDPNQQLQIEVRGKTNVAGLTEEYVNDPNQPLFILDGFESTLATISDLSMDRVQSITLLKDAAATAIYGSKAANGVVVVETKAPEAGKLKVNYNGNFGFTWADLTDYNLMNAKEKLEFEKLANCYGRINPATGIPTQSTMVPFYNAAVSEVGRGVDTYWLSEPLRFAFSHRHNVFVEGGDKTFRYGVGANIGNTEGVMKGSNRKVANGNIRLIYRMGKLSFTNSTDINYTKADHEPVAFRKFAQASPYLRKYDEDGNIPLMQNYDRGQNENIYNPMYNWQNNNMNVDRTNGFTNNFQMEWNPIQELRGRVKLGISNSNSRARKFASPFNTEFFDTTAEERGRYSESKSSTWTYDGDVSLTYGQVFAELHRLNAVIGVRMTKSDNESSGFAMMGFTDDDVISTVFAQDFVAGSGSTIETDRRTASYYANLNYAFDNRYLLDASWRKDGSSVFGVNKHFTDTWSLGLGWNIHNETFMKKQHFINYLKIRASIGNPGNQNFSDYISTKIFSYDSNFPRPWGSSTYISSWGNDNLKWQKTLDKNLGVDLYIINSRLRLNFDIFEKNTDPLLVTMTLPSSAGSTSMPTNMGALVTSGYTARANFQIIKQEDFIWTINGSVSHIKSEYRDIGNSLEEFNGVNLTKNMERFYDGASPTALWTVRSAGIDPGSGNELFFDKEGNMTFTYDSDDEVICGDTNPDYEGVFGTSFYYKGFSVSVNFRYRVGGQAFMSALYNKVENITTRSRWYNQDRRALYDRWKQPGDQAKFKGIDEYDTTPLSSRFIQDNNILRGESFSIGYETQARWLKAIGASSMTIRAYMNDLFNISSIKEERGIDYPFARSASLSLGLRF